MGGEKAVVGTQDQHHIGSPPRGRGKGFFHGRSVPLAGITPAWAGKRPSFLLTSFFKRDHPRVGGEKVYSPSARKRQSGSPPRGRGKGDVDLKIPGLNRITPAWAGKSLASNRAVRGYKDHPRVGGEKYALKSPDGFKEGSPPRGRGKGSGCWASPNRQRITPAWAGKSLADRRLCGLCRDHPRVGGEKTPEQRKKLRDWGSPPRGRGKAGGSPPPHRGAGITPAWAGKRRNRQGLRGL